MSSTIGISWLNLLGGFALFLFGIHLMSEYLKVVTGDKLKNYIEKFTNKTWKGILVGILITALIQSSSATTAIMISFIRANIMKLNQSVGLILGANIGTTVTAFLIGLKIEKYALFFIFFGVLLIVFNHKRKINATGFIILGFGLLFYGLTLMGDELKLLKDLPQFQDFALSAAKQPLLAVLVSTVMTALVQSSSVTIGIVQNLFDSKAMSLLVSVAMIFGSNIGTTITGALSAIGGGTSAKRAACIHILFNIIGSIIFLIFLQQYSQVVELVMHKLQLNGRMTIAFAHILFNVACTLIFIPFVSIVVKFVEFIFKDEKHDDDYTPINLSALDVSLIQNLPTAALDVVRKSTIDMGKLSLYMLRKTSQFLKNKERKTMQKIIDTENDINLYDVRLTKYLLQLGSSNDNFGKSSEYLETIQVIKNIERIGDITLVTAQLFNDVFENNESFSEKAIRDIDIMIELASDVIKSSLHYFETKDSELAQYIIRTEKELDNQEEILRQKHYRRMSTNECKSEKAGIFYFDILSNIERIGDHGENIMLSANIMPLHDNLYD